MIYEVIFSSKAKEDLKKLKKSEPKAFQKAVILISELMEHPKTGTGKPTLKKYNLAGFYARKITDKHRLVYSIDDDKIIVQIVSARGHYDDK
ncbi:Txe/YoeB family addiction module toxin [Empedobacter brevis]|uniref:Putative mRNA interferase YoeB n=1 Tax=Empedobacter brevis TaxID=247 RepID=A0AAJ1V9S5_9FLAO|nr:MULTISPECIES: Txe/YoeB family addiction module toxin [Empedobacter]MDM1074347.1 Txe/YoeB family addiction module toxin [Empedobacter brevis]MDM1139952.1 Txe/YoeB family addiction module toxin [Empedobacter sp. R132-2]